METKTKRRTFDEAFKREAVGMLLPSFRSNSSRRPQSLSSHASSNAPAG
jgi:hypothetical protein